MGCRYNDTKLLSHVENAHYGDTYPIGKLPLPMCRTEVERDARKILGLAGEMPGSGASSHGAAGHTKIDDLLRRTVKKPEKPKHSREQLCDLCEKSRSNGNNHKRGYNMHTASWILEEDYAK